MQPLDQEPSAKKTIIAATSSISLIITVIITFTFFSSLPRQQSIIEPINTSTYPILKEFDFTIIGQTIQDLIVAYYEISTEELSNLKANIRESTIQYDTNSNDKITSIQFIIDINQPRLTYMISDQVDANDTTTLSCPPIELVQDPSVFCIGSDQKTTIDVNLSQYLPHQSTTRNGINYYLRQESGIINNPQLIAYANICNKDANMKEVKNDIEFWLIQHGISNPEIIPISIKDSGCS